MHQTTVKGEIRLEDIRRLDSELKSHFKGRIVQDRDLSRQLASFQADKLLPSYRWFKYKEAFSPALVEHLLRKYGATTGRLLDPFAGIGTALFAASALGMDADGIELLPVGKEVIETRLLLEKSFSDAEHKRLEEWMTEKPWERSTDRSPIHHLRITEGAYPSKTLESIEKFLFAIRAQPPSIQSVLRFALMCILESISYTRKDGQYLRWDDRSKRRSGKIPFHKGKIHGFDEAICNKIREILSDVRQNAHSLFPKADFKGSIKVLAGSCLDSLLNFPSATYNAIVTSPPYCNRYDYTRTYALELALLGVNEENLSKLRQEMLSCTVENREKDLVGICKAWESVVNVVNRQPLLSAIIQYLENQKAMGELNNNGIPRMVRGYFYELSCVIAECHRTLRPGAYMFMVNDNVRYAGASISVDLILSKIAEEIGFVVENVLVLPQGKGNSSQQMAEHGREPLRKCVYVWRKC